MVTIKPPIAKSPLFCNKILKGSPSSIINSFLISSIILIEQLCNVYILCIVINETVYNTAGSLLNLLLQSSNNFNTDNIGISLCSIR